MLSARAPVRLPHQRHRPRHNPRQRVMQSSAPATTPDATAPATASDTGTPAPAASSASAAAASASAAASNTTPAAPVAAVPPVASAKSSSAPTATASAQAVGKTRGAQPASADRLPQAPAAPATPSQSAQNFAPAPSPAPAPQAAPATPPPPAVNPELAELRQKFNETSIRASTARNGLNSFQQQQARQGLGLRADIREAQTRMDYQLQEATAYLQRGDIENARTEPALRAKRCRNDREIFGTIITLICYRGHVCAPASCISNRRPRACKVAHALDVLPFRNRASGIYYLGREFYRISGFKANYARPVPRAILDLWPAQRWLGPPVFA